MTTSTIVWIVVIAVAAIVLIGLIAASMRKKSRADNQAQAAHLREDADTRAAGLPDAQARVDQAEDRAATARLEAERAEDQASSVRADADQQRAIHEDQIRAADRLDPQVDHKSKDYSPEVADPAGPSNLGADNASIAGIGSDSVSDTASTSTPTNTAPGTPAPNAEASTTAASAGAGSSVTLGPTDTAPRDETIGTDTAPRDETISTDQTSLHDRIQGDDAPDSDSTQDTDPRAEGSGGAHRA